MPILLAILGMLAAAGIWLYRLRAARETAGELVDAAQDVVLAARRFGFRRRLDVHPADAIDDPRLAAAGIALAVAGIDGPHTQAELAGLAAECRNRFNVGAREAEDMVAFGRWIAGQCGTPEEAVRRLARVVRAKAPEAGADLVAMVETLATIDGRIGAREGQALDRLREAFRPR